VPVRSELTPVDEVEVVVVAVVLVVVGGTALVVVGVSALEVVGAASLVVVVVVGAAAVVVTGAGVEVVSELGSPPAFPGATVVAALVDWAATDVAAVLDGITDDEEERERQRFRIVRLTGTLGAAKRLSTSAAVSSTRC